MAVATNLRASITSVGPLIHNISQDLGLSPAGAGLLTSVPVLAFGLFSPAAPWVARRLGLELTVFGSLLLLIAAVLARSLPVPGLIWAGTVGLGIAIAFFNVLLPSLIKRDFPHRLGGMTGAYTTVQTLVAAVASGVAVPIAGQTPGGWRISLGIWAGLALIAAAVWLPQLRSRTLPDAVDGGPVTRRVWTSPISWQVTIFMGLQSMSFYTFIAWLPSIMVSRGVSEATSGLYLFVYLVAGVIASSLTPIALQRTADQRVVNLGGSILLVIGVAGLLLLPGAAMLWVIIEGLGAGSCIVLALSLFGFRARDHEESAALSGMGQSVGYLLAAVGPLAIGALHQFTGSWIPPLLFLLFFMLALCVFAVLSGRKRFI
ncbi:MFS transporter [Paenarthrobacter sp. Z7-10]|nr:MFS transporter [Paenarthrobacter sp. Z7-10]